MKRGNETKLFIVPPDEPEEYRIHREAGGKAPAAGLDGTVYARFPKGPSTEELAQATKNFLMANKPEALESKV